MILTRFSGWGIWNIFIRTPLARQASFHFNLLICLHKIVSFLCLKSTRDKYICFHTKPQQEIDKYTCKPQESKVILNNNNSKFKKSEQVNNRLFCLKSLPGPSPNWPRAADATNFPWPLQLFIIYLWKYWLPLIKSLGSGIRHT